MRKLLIFALMVGLFAACSQEQTAPLKVMTYNLKYDNAGDSVSGWQPRRAFLISQVAYNQPDVLGTQEGLKHQLDDMKSNLEGYDYIGIGREKNNTGEFTAVFYNTNTITVGDTGTFWLSETPEQVSRGWDAGYNRVCTYAIFTQKASGKRFLMLNTHLDNEGPIARKNGVQLVLDRMAEINTENLPVIITGDFNAVRSDVALAPIFKELVESHQTAKVSFGPEGSFNGFVFNRPVQRKIDYVFVSPQGFDVEKSAILSDSKNCRYPSDHFPVMSTLNFK